MSSWVGNHSRERGTFSSWGTIWATYTDPSPHAAFTAQPRGRTLQVSRCEDLAFAALDVSVLIASLVSRSCCLEAVLFRSVLYRIWPFPGKGQHISGFPYHHFGIGAKHPGRGPTAPAESGRWEAVTGSGNPGHEDLAPESSGPLQLAQDRASARPRMASRKQGTQPKNERSVLE